MSSRTKKTVMLHTLLLLSQLLTSALGQVSHLSKLPMGSNTFAKNTGFSSGFSSMTPVAKGYNPMMQTGSYPMNPNYWTGHMSQYPQMSPYQPPYYSQYYDPYMAQGWGAGPISTVHPGYSHFQGQYPEFDPMYWSGGAVGHQGMYMPPSYTQYHPMPMYHQPMYHQPMYHQPMYHPQMYHPGMVGPYYHPMDPYHYYPPSRRHRGFLGGTGSGLKTFMGAAAVGLLAGAIANRNGK